VSQGAQAIIEVAEEPLVDLSELRGAAPPPALVARVMTRVAEPTTPTLWRWLTCPVRVEVRISPLGVVACAVMLAAALALFVSR
jgi:hypothetical protein